MNIAVDANVLVRAVTRDDPVQAALALRTMQDATSIAVTVAAICEFVWVLDRSYKRRRSDIARSLRELIGDRRVVCDLPAVEAGLAVLEAGGDFADGVIAFDGFRLNAGAFVTFDRHAAQINSVAGGRTLLLTS